jgi:hypothetical protein
MRVPAKQALGHVSTQMVVSVELLIVSKRLKVRLDRERHDGRRAIGQVLFQRLRVYAGGHVDDDCVSLEWWVEGRYQYNDRDMAAQFSSLGLGAF